MFATHEVRDSRWVADRVELDAHEDAGAADAWAGTGHFFLTFHDRAVEALARGISARPFVGTWAEGRREGFRAVSSAEDEPVWLT